MLETPEDRNAMSFRQLVAWAWQETPPVHKNGANLLIHLFAVPLFVLGHLLIIAGIALSFWLLIAGVWCIVVSMIMQKIGHSLERTPVHAFTGARDVVRRLYAEQFWNYWRFLFSGGWYSSFKARHTA